ncbi:MAG: hypothetical protein IJD30_01380 [Clostridia bacterium]|nr:hypothetical protein [Clostridia bacterium]
METNTEDQAGTQYVVRVGGEDVSVTKGEGEDAKTYSYYETVITVTTTTAGTTVEYEEIIAGDIDGFNGVDDTDAAHILTASLDIMLGMADVYNEANETMIAVERTTENGDVYIMGDIDGFNGVDDTDAAHILTASLDIMLGLVDTYNEANETMIGNPIIVEVIE